MGLSASTRLGMHAVKMSTFGKDLPLLLGLGFKLNPSQFHVVAALCSVKGKLCTKALGARPP